MIYRALDSALDAAQSCGLNVHHLCFALPAAIVVAYLWAAFFGKDGR